MVEPPLPPMRASDGLTRSELLPLGSSRINILRSRALLPFVLTAATCVALFSTYFQTKKFDATLYMSILATFFVLITFLALYLFSGERKSVFAYIWPAALTVLQLAFAFQFYFYLTRTYLPGDTESAAKTFSAQFVANVFGPGLSEEFLKAGALFVGLLVAAWLRRSGRPGNRLTRVFALEGPIDGMLMGAAAGGAFILIETLLQYVPDTVRSGSSAAAGAASGLMLLIPRVLNGLVGHMAYSAVFGYFAGLAVSHPRATFRLLLLGWTLAALLHGFWNASPYLHLTWGLAASAALTGIVFFSCFTKARQLEASRLGLPVDGRSILALTPRVATGARVPAGTPPPHQGGLGEAVSALATALERSVGVRARTTVPPGPPVLVGPDVPPSGLTIGAGDDIRYALAPGRPIDFSSLFAFAGVPSGCSGMVEGGPDGALSIRNTGPATWAVSRPDGSAGTVAPNAAVGPLQSGMKLVLGHAMIDLQAY